MSYKEALKGKKCLEKQQQSVEVSDNNKDECRSLSNDDKGSHRDLEGSHRDVETFLMNNDIETLLKEQERRREIIL